MTTIHAKRAIAVTSPLGEDVLLFRKMDGTEHLSRPFEYELQLFSENGQIDPNAVLGRPMAVELEVFGGAKRYFHGVVSRFSYVDFSNRFALYRATLRPWLWFLTRTADCRIFQEKTIPDIIKTIFRDSGFTDFEERLEGRYESRDYCVQYRETDFDFVNRLMEEEGIYYYFLHESSKHVLVLSDSYQSHDFADGYADVPFYPPQERSRRERDHIFEWSFTCEVQSGSSALTDFDFTRPSANLMAKSLQPREHAHAELEIYDYPGRYVDRSLGERYTHIRTEERAAQYKHAHGEANSRGLGAGNLFNLVNFPRADQNQEYLLVSVTHDLVSDEFNTTPTPAEEEIYRCRFTAMESHQPFRPPRLTPKPIVQGPQTAIVVGKSGEEIWTDEHGRVKVQFHWDREGKRDENSSCWVRVSHPWAGKSWGSVAIPRIGQEVIVDFLEGDPDRPIITGRVYNGQQRPPYGLPAAAVISGIKTNSTKGGGGYNEMSMDDTKGREKITIHGQYDMETTVEHDQRTTVHNDRTQVIDGLHTETIKKNTTITITEGNLSHDVATGTATYHVKSAVVENFDDTQTTTVEKKITITSSTAEIHVIAEKEILLQTGASSLLMKKDGTIVLSGKDITVIGSATVKESAPKVEITGTQEVKAGVGTQTVTCNTAKVETSGAGITTTAVGVHEITGALVKIN